MEKQQKKQIKKYISWVLIVAIVVLLAFLPVIAAKEKVSDGPQASVLTAAAQLRDVSTVVMGGGTLTAQEAVEITIPSAVKVKEYLVSNGDLVAEGQPIARVDRVSVMSAISQVQETMEYLQEQIDDVRDETAPTAVNATAGGVVKIIYGAADERVQDVMLRDGALAVLSLDGMMAVKIERNTDLAGGDTVCVTLSDGTEVDGRVESNLAGVLTVTVEDEGYEVGQHVKVTTVDGDRIGSGTLYIHSQWNVVAYSGTISRVRVTQGEEVRAGRTIFELKDTGHAAEFVTLTRQYRSYEELMLELFRMYQDEVVTAPRDGMITGVDKNGTFMLSDTGEGWTVTLLANAPNGDDETSYVNYIGRVTEVGIDGLIMQMNPQPLAVTDYKDLSGIPTDPALMTESVIYSANAPVYELSGEEWTQIDPASVTAGDTLLFAGDAVGNFVWVVRVAKAPVQPDVPEQTEPADPTEPVNPPGDDPASPTEPGASDQPTMPSQPGMSGGFPQGGMGMSGMGGMVQEDVFTLYGLDTITIASVTAQEITTVQITVDELDISGIYVGQRATVMVDALMGEQFEGTVTSISGSGENSGGNSKFTVEITMNKVPDMLPGMRASVSIVISSLENVICLPVAALVETGTETQVYTGYDEEKETYLNPVTVTAGVSDGEYVQILTGLDEGQTVYYPYYDTLVESDAPDMSGFPFG